MEGSLQEVGLLVGQCQKGEKPMENEEDALLPKENDDYVIDDYVLE